MSEGEKPLGVDVPEWGGEGVVMEVRACTCVTFDTMRGEVAYVVGLICIIGNFVTMEVVGMPVTCMVCS